MKSKNVFRLLSCLALVVSSRAADLNVQGSVTITAPEGSPYQPSVRMSGDGGLYFMGKDLSNSGASSFMTSGYGMLFDSKLSALFVGNCYPGSGGRFSLAVGYMPVAQGENSMAIGHESRTTASNSLAVGHYSYASGASSVAMGNSAYAYGATSIAVGSSVVASGASSFAVGSGAQAMGAQSAALGQSIAGGTAAVSMGSATTAAAYSVAVGRFNKIVNIDGGAVNGTGWTDTDPLFSVGNGTGSGTQQRKDAFVVYKDGRIRIDKPQGDILMGDFQ